MKYLVFKLFSGVGLCNQIFSLETAIYMANIMNRKLILLIPHPLCHVGKATWDYGYLLNYFEENYLKYLPFGLDVYYKDIPKDINDIFKSSKSINPTNRFSQTVFVDKNLDIPSNIKNIENFCHKRTKFVFDLLQYNNDYISVDGSNASRCFYNFYTSKQNYLLMFNICCSLKFKQIFQDIANSIYSNLDNGTNSFKIFTHLRFGDHSRKQSLIEMHNDKIIKNLTEYFDGHRTNMIKPQIYFLIDSERNEKFTNSMKKYNYKTVSNIAKETFDVFMKKNDMVFHSYHSSNNNSVAHAIIEMLLASKANEFIGFNTSTFSNYIQFLRYCDNRSYYNYCNLDLSNNCQCRLTPVKDNNIEWIKFGYNGGHPVSWHKFWNPFPEEIPTFNLSSEGKWDGFGSQLQAVYSLIAYCEYKNYNYIHTPFHRMHHNDENLSDFPSLMNSFVNLESQFKSVNSLTNYEKSRLYKFREGYMVHGSFHPEFFYTNKVIEKIRKCYYSSNKPDISKIFLKDKYNIAVHIRRGDVSATQHVQRYTSNDTYIQLLSKMKLPNNSFIHIFSEGSPNDFKEFTNKYKNITLHLNTNIKETFHCMVKADLLILSKSSFSYCAGLLNENKVDGEIIKNWWHKPLKKWI